MAAGIREVSAGSISAASAPESHVTGTPCDSWNWNSRRSARALSRSSATTSAPASSYPTPMPLAASTSRAKAGHSASDWRLRS